MVVATCVLKLQLFGVYSLKEKRQIIKSVCRRLANEFNVAVAETNHHDVWQSAELGIVTIGTDSGHLHGRLEQLVRWVEQKRPDLVIEQYQINFR